MPKRSRAAVMAIAGAFSIAGVYACAAIAGIGDLEIAACKGGVCDAAAPDTGRTEGGPTEGGAEASDCPGTAGPPGVRVPTNPSFCIDRNEVTFGDYRAFLAVKGTDFSGQPPECAFNSSFSPTIDGPDDMPVTTVDWCDAVAYCKWAGKRLCGKFGGDGGALTVAEHTDPLLAQWLNVCTAGGRNVYSYGSTFKPVCNTQETDAGATVPVGSLPECVGGYPGVYDMIGNAWEWTDVTCAPGDGGPETDSCYLRGGSYRLIAGQEAGVTCRSGARGPRAARITDVGFRCCSQ